MAETENGTITYRYIDLSGEEFKAITMASESQREATVRRLYPEWAYDSDLGPLGNWRDAVADENGVTPADVKRNLGDFLGPLYNDKVFNNFIWYLA